MEKVLSQEEIDALLKGIETGKVDTTSAPAEGSAVSSFDFANQERIIRGRMPTLEILNDFLARMLRNEGPTSEPVPDVYGLLDWPSGTLIFQGTQLSQVAPW